MSFIFDNKQLTNSIHSIEANMIKTKINTQENKIKNLDANIDNIIKTANKFIANTENNFKTTQETEAAIFLKLDLLEKDLKESKKEIIYLNGKIEKNKNQFKIYILSWIILIIFLIVKIQLIKKK